MIMIRTCGDNNSQVDNDCNYKNDFQNIARRNVQNKNKNINKNKSENNDSNIDNNNGNYNNGIME